jgi:hypothetical protein
MDERCEARHDIGDLAIGDLIDGGVVFSIRAVGIRSAARSQGGDKN